MENCIRTLGILTGRWCIMKLVHSDIGNVNKTADQYYIQVFFIFIELA